MTMPLYGSIESCPKCGAKRPKLGMNRVTRQGTPAPCYRYHAAHKPYFGPAVQEFMRVSCACCGFTWYEECYVDGPNGEH